MKNTLYCGDNLDILRKHIKDESVDLIYIDPPFFSNRHYEVVWGDEAEIRSFEDRWEGGINVYVDWMKQRIIELHRVLKSTGSFYLHCDWHAGHYLKVMCDEVFGYSNFRNEIVWCYSIGGKSSKTFGRKHDTIFWYTKGRTWIFNADAPSIRIQRKPDSHMRVVVDESGTTWQEKTDAKTKKVYRYPLDKVADDYWTNIEQLNREDAERLGYPTQKPEALLKRIVEASSNKGDIVLDSFCGCGTTMVVAERLKRRWIGIDISPSAIALVKKRLNKVGVKEKDIDIIGMPTKVDDLRAFKPFEFQYWAINEMHGTPSPRKVGDLGIDGLSFLHHCPIQVKQSESVGRNVVDNFQTAIRRYYKSHKSELKGYIVAFSFTKGAHEEIARIKREGIIINLVTVQDILDRKFQTQQLADQLI